MIKSLSALDRRIGGFPRKNVSVNILCQKSNCYNRSHLCMPKGKVSKLISDRLLFFSENKKPESSLSPVFFVATPFSIIF